VPLKYKASDGQSDFGRQPLFAACPSPKEQFRFDPDLKKKIKCPETERLIQRAKKTR
jgi:hypothetical protein